MKLKPLKDKVLIHNLEKGGRTLSSGIVLLNDDGKEHGIRARWAQVYAVGPEMDYLETGQWVLVEHGRWSRGLEIERDHPVYTADNASILAVSDEEPQSDYVGTTSGHGEKKIRMR